MGYGCNLACFAGYKQSGDVARDVPLLLRKINDLRNKKARVLSGFDHRAFTASGATVAWIAPPAGERADRLPSSGLWRLSR